MDDHLVLVKQHPSRKMSQKLNLLEIKSQENTTTLIKHAQIHTGYSGTLIINETN